MKKVFGILILLFAVMIFHSSANAQNNGHRIVGIGVNVLDITNIISGQGSTIYIPINVASAFRLEPFLGFNTISYDPEGDADESETNMQLGIGILPTIRRKNAVIYIGGRIGIAFGSEENKDSNGDVYRKNSDFSFGLGPVLGGEYYFNPHISLGGEMAISYRTSTYKTDYTNQFQDDEEDKISGIGTESKIFIRFYF